MAAGLRGLLELVGAWLSAPGAPQYPGTASALVFPAATATATVERVASATAYVQPAATATAHVRGGVA